MTSPFTPPRKPIEYSPEWYNTHARKWYWVGSFMAMLAVAFLIRVLTIPEDRQGLRLIYGGAFLVAGGVLYACSERNRILCNRRDEAQLRQQKN